MRSGREGVSQAAVLAPTPPQQIFKKIKIEINSEKKEIMPHSNTKIRLLKTCSV